MSCKIKSLFYAFDSLVNIRLINKKICKYQIEKNEFLRNIWFSVYLINQIRLQTFLEISANFYND